MRNLVGNKLITAKTSIGDHCLGIRRHTVYSNLMPNITYRELKETDAPAVSELRLSVLKSNPGTFSISIDEEKRGSIESLKHVLANYQSAQGRTIFGAFDKSLVGMIGVEQFQGEFTLHKARIWGLYVVQSHRTNGIATALIAQSIDFAKGLDGVEKIILEVTDAATDARRLYQGHGFNITGSETNALKVGQRYIDCHRMELSLTTQQR